MAPLDSMKWVEGRWRWVRGGWDWDMLMFGVFGVFGVGDGLWVGDV